MTTTRSKSLGVSVFLGVSVYIMYCFAALTVFHRYYLPKRAVPKGGKLIHGYTPLIGPEAWLSTTGKMRISSASTFVFYSFPHPQIRTSAFYHRPPVFYALCVSTSAFFWNKSLQVYLGLGQITAWRTPRYRQRQTAVQTF